MSYPNPGDEAIRFAKMWYERLPSGCDEATLASMLTELLRNFGGAVRLARQEETLAKLERLLK